MRQQSEFRRIRVQERQQRLHGISWPIDTTQEDPSVSVIRRVQHREARRRDDTGSARNRDFEDHVVKSWIRKKKKKGSFSNIGDFHINKLKTCFMVPMRSRRHLDSARVFLSEQNMQQTKLNMEKK